MSRSNTHWRRVKQEPKCPSYWTSTRADKQKPSKVNIAVWCPESFPAHHSKTLPACPMSLQRGNEPRPGWTHTRTLHRAPTSRRTSVPIQHFACKTQLPVLSRNETESLASVCFRVYLHTAFTMSNLWGVHRAPKKQEESKEQMLSNPSANVFLYNFRAWGKRNPGTIHIR